MRSDSKTIRQALQGWFRFLWLGLMGVGILAGGWRPDTWFNYYLRMSQVRRQLG